MMHDVSELMRQDILVVDDVAANLQFLTSLLSKAGYRVRPASGGELALRSVAAKPPYLILLDVKMPGIDGYEVCRRLKADERSCGIPVIFISALAASSEKVEGFNAGGVDFITKPFEPQEVLARVKTHMRLRELSDRLEQRVLDRTAELAQTNARLREEISVRTQAEQAIKQNVLFLQRLERLDTILRKTSDMQLMMRLALDVVLDVMEADRAWLLYPCDPNALSWTVPMLCAKPEYAGVLSTDQQVPMSAMAHDIFKTCLESDDAVHFGPEGDAPLHPDNQKLYSVQSQLVLALHPRLDQPWMFGVHQCVRPRVWTDQEKTLFTAMGGRIQDALNNFLFLRDLRESEERFRALVDQAQDAIFVHDLTGRFLLVNQSARDALGFNSEEFSLMSVTDVDPEFHARNDPELFWKSLPQTFESQHVKKDGGLLPVEIRLSKITYGDRQVIHAAARDITKRKQAEVALRKYQRFIESIINSMPSLIVSVDAQCRITQWNRLAEEASGVSASMAKGRLLRELLPHLAEEDKIRSAIIENKTQRDSKVPRPGPGGTRYEDVTIYPLPSNGVDGAVIRVDDATERTRVDEMLAQSDKMLAIGGLAAGMAHEIKNPLSVVISAAQIINQRIFEDIPKNLKAAEESSVPLEGVRAYMEKREIRALLDSISESGVRAGRIITNMLSFSRKSDVSLSPHNLAELLDFSLNLAAYDFDMKKKYDFREIEIVREYDPELQDVLCNGGEMQQVFLNVLKNAAEAMSEKEYSSGKMRITLRTYKKNSSAYVEIEDNGPGIEENVKEQIFNPFYTTKKDGFGTGLGLSVSYYIVTRQHGGTIQAQSHPGEGTKFIITIPFKTCRTSDHDAT